jgi:hypothetical protein
MRGPITNSDMNYRIKYISYVGKKYKYLVGKKVEVAEFLATYRPEHGSMGRKNPP